MDSRVQVDHNQMEDKLKKQKKNIHRVKTNVAFIAYVFHPPNKTT